MEAGRKRNLFTLLYTWRRLVLLITFILIMLLLGLWPRMVFVIPSGHAGVVYRTFWGGTVTRTVRDEGLQVILPWNTLTVYDVRLQQVEQQFTVISNDGLEIHVSLSIRYSPKVELLGLLHKKIGPDYLRKIIIPDVHSLIRTTFGQYTPEEIYRTKRSLIQETFQSALSNLGDKYVEMDDLLIKSIELPEMIKTAIENKHVEQQLMLQMRFRIDRERQEALRKEIEANGVDRFQTIVNRSLTPQLLQYKGIEALAKLAQSPNSKLVLAGGGANGVPLILDTTGDSPVRNPVINVGEGGTLATNTTGDIQTLMDEESAPDPSGSPQALMRWFENRKKALSVHKPSGSTTGANADQGLTGLGSALDSSVTVDPPLPEGSSSDTPFKSNFSLHGSKASPRPSTTPGASPSPAVTPAAP